MIRAAVHSQLQQVDLSPGVYLLGSRTKAGAAFPLGTLWLRRANEASNRHGVGQWALSIDQVTGPAVGKVRERLIGSTSRLGITPVHFRAHFLSCLRSDEPICLVADTSALFHGTLEAALRVRGSRPVHVAVPDQVMMELQRQREHSWSSNPTAAAETRSVKDVPAIETWLSDTQRYPRRVAASRALRRIRKAGYILHLARPPEAMVRFFGGDSGSSGGEEQTGAPRDVGPNYLRDRLILESVHQQRSELSGVATWLVTADANLAAHADVEGFHVGFGWRSTMLQPPLVSSPTVDPHTLGIYHVPFSEFAEELTWSWGNLWIQPTDSTTRMIWQLPSDSGGDNARQHVLTELGEPGSLIPQTTERASKWTRTTLAAAPAQAPIRAPTPQNLLNTLVDLSAFNPPTGIPIPSDVVAYLKAAGWAQDGPSGSLIVSRGSAVVTDWCALNYQDQSRSRAWFDAAGADIATIDTVAQFLAALSEVKSSTEDTLAKTLNWHPRVIQSQAVLANAFGLAVRVGGKTWRAAKQPTEQVVARLESLVQTLQGETRSGSVEVERAFTGLLDTGAVSFMAFREAIAHLLSRGQIGIGGTSPKKRSRTSTPVKLRILLPSDGRALHQEIDLSSGEHIVAGESVQVLWLVRGGALR